MLSTVAALSATSVRPCQRWRGLGRMAFFAGETRDAAHDYARGLVTHDLDATEQMLVVAGWDDASRETAEVRS